MDKKVSEQVLEALDDLFITWWSWMLERDKVIDSGDLLPLDSGQSIEGVNINLVGVSKVDVLYTDTGLVGKVYNNDGIEVENGSTLFTRYLSKVKVS